jgi:UDP-N-acetylglucosamine 2-epimerase (non-hydrolysing)
MKNCELILTDSGGIQEEATSPEILKPVVVLRRSTERPEAIENGFARLVDLNSGTIIRVIEQIIRDPPSLSNPSPFGDGKASERIVSSLYYTSGERASK